MQDDWFNIRDVGHEIFLIEEPQHVLCYLIRGKTRAALIDTGMGFRNIGAALKSLIETPLLVFNTHWHFDHIGGNAEFRDIGIAKAEQHLLTQRIPNAALMSFYLRPCLEQHIPLPKQFGPEHYEICSPPATFTFDDGNTFDLGGRVLTAISTPGHTHGSFSFLDSGTRSLFCGDVVYRASLYAHFVDSDVEEYIQSLRKLLTYRDRINNLYPGHCDYLLPPSFLLPVLQAFHAIKTDVLSGSIAEEWGEPVVRYEFEDFAILVKAPGSPGVDLQRMLRC